MCSNCIKNSGTTSSEHMKTSVQTALNSLGTTLIVAYISYISRELWYMKEENKKSYLKLKQ